MGGLTHTTIECMLGNVHHSTNHGLLPEFESQQRLNAVVQVQLLLQKAARHVLLQRKRYPDTINGTKRCAGCRGGRQDCSKHQP